MLNKLKKYMMSRQKPIIFEQPLRTEPLNRDFGVNQGTPIDRWYIEHFLGSHREQITGTVLEIAESTYTHQFGTRVQSSEILHVAPEAGATIVGDLSTPDSLPENLADCFICTQTLNFIPTPAEALRGAFKLLKPNGVLLATVSGLSQISRFDEQRWGDYWRFTRQGVEHLLKQSDFRDYQICVYGNLAAAKALLDGVPVEQLPNVEFLSFHDPEYQLILGIWAKK